MSQGVGQDKDWVMCDTSSTTHYENCYMEWGDNENNNRIVISTYADGGISWSLRISAGGAPSGLGDQPH